MYIEGYRLSVKVFNVTFNNVFSYIVALSLIGGGSRCVPGENHWHAAIHWQLYHIVDWEICNSIEYV